CEAVYVRCRNGIEGCWAVLVVVFGSDPVGRSSGVRDFDFVQHTVKTAASVADQELQPLGRAPQSCGTVRVARIQDAVHIKLHARSWRPYRNDVVPGVRYYGRVACQVDLRRCAVHNRKRKIRTDRYAGTPAIAETILTSPDR